MEVQFAPGLSRLLLKFTKLLLNQPEKYLNHLIKIMSAPDQAIFNDPIYRRNILANLREAYQQGENCCFPHGRSILKKLPLQRQYSMDKKTNKFLLQMQKYMITYHQMLN